MCVILDLYLVQHAEAKTKEEDPERSLTDEGWKAIEAVAAHCATLNMRLDGIYHSGKLRAQQTAEVLARHLNAMEKLRMQPGLDPLDDVKPTQEWLARQAQQGVSAIAIVGHLPFLEKLVSALITQDERAGVVAVRHAGVMKLILKQSGLYAVEWILTPEIAARKSSGNWPAT